MKSLNPYNNAASTTEDPEAEETKKVVEATGLIQGGAGIWVQGVQSLSSCSLPSTLSLEVPPAPKSVDLNILWSRLLGPPYWFYKQGSQDSKKWGDLFNLMQWSGAHSGRPSASGRVWARELFWELLDQGLLSPRKGAAHSLLVTWDFLQQKEGKNSYPLHHLNVSQGAGSPISFPA